MNEARILLFGKRGQVGWELERTLAPLGTVLAVGRAEADLTDGGKLAGLVADVRPSLIINAAAYTAVDRAESEPELARQINAVAPGVLAAAADKAGAWLIHFSTDYVFDGTRRRPYVETDLPNPLGVYGRTKLAGEQAVQAAVQRHLIFRLSWVYALRGHNFLLTMQRLAREHAELRVVNDQFGAPTWSRVIAEAVTAVAQRLLAGEASGDLPGIYHLACAGQTSWHGFASRIVERMPASARRARAVIPIATTEYPTPAQRPAWSVLDCSKLQRTFGIQLPDWEAALQRALEQP
jgi:dTDP-4-dehydrorhamnose reductase